MSEPYLGQISIYGFNFPPRGFAECNGQLLPIEQNQSLYSLLGTTYGGDGDTTFGLPDLQGRVPIHKGQSVGANHPLGQRSGEERHALTVGEMPAHTHPLRATSANASLNKADGNLWATSGHSIYHALGSSPVAMAADAVGNSGNGQSHENMQPYLAVNFCISLTGLFPSRN